MKINFSGTFTDCCLRPEKGPFLFFFSFYALFEEPQRGQEKLRGAFAAMDGSRRATLHREINATFQKQFQAALRPAEGDENKRESRRRPRLGEDDDDRPFDRLLDQPLKQASQPECELLAESSQRKKKKARSEPQLQQLHAAMPLEGSLEAQLRKALRALQPTPDDVSRRRRALCDLAKVLQEQQILAQIYGSSRTGLALPWSDIDVFACEPPPGRDFARETPLEPSVDGTGSSQSIVPLISSSMMAMSRREREAFAGLKLSKILRALRGRGSPFGSINPIRHARVPIVKCRHIPTGIEVDCSLSVDGLATSDYLNHQLGSPGMALGRPLIVLVKALLEKHGLNDPSVGGLGSFATSLLVLWFLRSEVIPHYPREELGNIAFVLQGLLHHYGNVFDNKRSAIDISRWTLFAKPLSNEIVVMNPLDPSQNSAKACNSFQRIAAVFRSAALTLQPLHGAGGCGHAAFVESQLRSVFGRQLERRQVAVSSRRGVEKAGQDRSVLPSEDDCDACNWDRFGIFCGAWL